jgi:hypothetical protein
MESERVEREVSPLHLLPQGVELLQLLDLKHLTEHKTPVANHSG